MLPKKYRIPKNDLMAVQRSGKRYSSDFFTLTIVRNTVSVSRFAVRVGTAVHKRAVIRNRIKRLFHESMRSILPTLPIPIDILCSIKRASEANTKERTTEFLQKELKKIL